jgi:hypothetical protein
MKRLNWAAIEPYLTPEERPTREHSRAKILQLVTSLPSAQSLASVAYAGRAKRGWYARSCDAIRHTFGPDTVRFVALLAALSPQTSIQSNASNALAVWDAWVAAGRPVDRERIVAIMGANVQGNGTVASVLPAWINNSVRALATPNPADIRLSGPKVASFMANLLGNCEEVTNDTWMAQVMGANPERLRQDGRKSPLYKAMNAVVRHAADILTDDLGERWTPAEVQETVWSFTRAQGGDVSAVPDFADLIGTETRLAA